MAAGVQLPLLDEIPVIKTGEQHVCEVRYSTPQDTVEIPEEKSEDEAVKLEIHDRGRFLYEVYENPSVPYSCCLALQQTAACFGGTFSAAFLLADIVCARADETLKARIICTTLFMSGLCTFLQSTVGVRLPVYQGPMLGYLTSLVALTSLPVWSCDAQSGKAVNGTANGTEPISTYTKLQRLEGSLMIAGAIHTVIGIFGITGFLLRFIGPITVVPALTLVALYIYPAAVRFAETQWGVAVLTATIGLILSFYLAKRHTPLPWYNKSKGFYIRWCYFHRTFAVLIAILFGWFVSWIITEAGGYDMARNSPHFFARTDSRLSVVDTAKWFIFPYPGQFGRPSYETGAILSFLVTTLASILDSVGDYYACAKIIEAPPPPKHAVNRGITIEGFVSFIAGWAGAGHATSTYGVCLGVLEISRVASLRVFQVLGVMLMVLGMCGKAGAIFVLIPYPVLGGLYIINIGVLIGVMLSNLEHIDISSRRNMSIIGISILLAMMLNYWTTTRPNAIDTGANDLDNALTMILANPIFMAGVVACILDNTMPGTREERGMRAWNVMETGEDDSSQVEKHDEIRVKKVLNTVYVIPYFNKVLKRVRALGYLPICPKYDATTEKQSSSSPTSTQF